MKYRFLKRVLVVILLFAAMFTAYVGIVNRNSKEMTVRQKVLKAVYPLFSGVKRMFGKSAKSLTNNNHIQPSKSIYQLSVLLNGGQSLNLDAFKGKKMLLVNTASDCGYTGQYSELEKLYRDYKNKLVIIAFPANDFKNQETGTDEEIEKFCTFNYGVTFPLAKKSTVVRSAEQNEVFKWLSEKKLNGWNDKAPSWNFSKYLVDENGLLTHYFDPAISPLSDEVLRAIRN